MLSSSYWATCPNEIIEQDSDRSIESSPVVDEPWTKVSTEIGAKFALTRSRDRAGSRILRKGGCKIRYRLQACIIHQNDIL